MLEYALAAGLTASGADACLLHVTTTPSMSLDTLGAKTYVIHNEPDGLNINEMCGSTHIQSFFQYAIDHKSDVGFAFDGDADRCLCVDEKGNVVDGYLILYIYGSYLKERGKLIGNKVVTTVMSNFGLYKAFDEIGIEYEKMAVGDKYVYENMNTNGYRIGGEPLIRVMVEAQDAETCERYVDQVIRVIESI